MNYEGVQTRRGSTKRDGMSHVDFTSFHLVYVEPGNEVSIHCSQQGGARINLDAA